MPLKCSQDVSPHTIKAEPVLAVVAAASAVTGGGGSVGGRAVGKTVCGREKTNR